MRYNNVELSVRVKGRTITEYPHNGQVFIEGRAGSEFEVVVKNHNNYRVEAVVAVDGLSVLDGKEAGPLSSGYVLNAFEEIAVPGWKLNATEVAAFEFGGSRRGGTYAEQATGSSRNNGVIGLLVYKENAPFRAFPNNPVYAFGGQPMNGRIGGGIMRGGFAPTTSDVWTLHDSSDASTYTALALNACSNNVDSTWETFGVGTVNAMSAVSPTSGMLDQRIGASLSAASPTRSAPRAMAQAAGGSRSRAKSIQPEAVAAVNNLGTVFGERTDFATTTVTFTRGDMQAMLVLNYDDARGLRQRGIALTRREKRAETPNAFPGFGGCTPPKGWRG